MVVAIRELTLISVLMVLLTAGWSTSQTSQSAPAQAQTNQNSGTSTQAASPAVQSDSNVIPCNPSRSLRYTLYKNDIYRFTFQCPEGLRVRFHRRAGNIGLLAVDGDKSASITLTINGPAVPLDSMQKTTLDQSITTNGIAMRKRLISDPVIGYPPHQDQEIIYDFSHGNNTFTWWAVLGKDDTVNQCRVNQIVGSFKFTD